MTAAACGLAGACATLTSLTLCKSRHGLSRAGVLLISSVAGVCLALVAENEQHGSAPGFAVRATVAAAVVFCVNAGRYDNARGEWSPFWRAHGVGMIGLFDQSLCVLQQGLMALAVAQMSVEFFGPTPTAAWLALPGTLALKALFGRPCSYPGNSRVNTTGRKPSWEAPAGGRPCKVEPGWLFAEAAESHVVTEETIARQLQEQGIDVPPEGLKLSGEPAGRQMWHFDPKLATSLNVPASPEFSAEANPNSADLLFRAQRQRHWERTQKSAKLRSPAGTTTEAAAPALQAARAGVAFYQTLQCDDGHWAGDYGGPMFLMPGMIITWYVTGRLSLLLDGPKTRAMQTYIRNHQQTDGGWGTHIESPSTMFGSTLNYVALRLLGAETDDDACVKARTFLKAHGGALYTSSWAKFWLCVLGVMHWDGHNSVPPEMWLLPDWTPFHPGRLWCHCRMVYLPMCWLYGQRFVYPDAESDPLVQALRMELYPDQDYSSIPWSRTRHWVAAIDNYSPVHPLMAVLQDMLVYWERYGGPLRRAVRARGLKFAFSYMQAEDLQTNYVDIGPVNKALNMLCTWVAAKRGNVPMTDFYRHCLRIPDYLWVAEDGMKMQGYNGSQCWDTSFAVQAIVEAGLGDEFPLPIRRAYRYLERTQILSTDVSRASPALAFEAAGPRRAFYRHVSEGGWPFSTSAHGWPISDCTAEGLKGMLALRELRVIYEWSDAPKVDDERMFKACNVLLTLQNSDGGFATYENNRGYGWFEWLNPSEVFGDIMIDYSYVECTNASIGALAKFRECFPHHRPQEVTGAIKRARQFLIDMQRPDGSWYGSWGCCFTYASWFGVEGLLHAGEPIDSPVMAKACRFLLKHQNANGGWGEDFTSCFDKTYAPDGMQQFGDQGSGVVCTGWALLALMAADCKDADAVTRGINYLIARQLPDGDWPQEGIAGVFNRACGITYTAYRNVFPVWALGRFANDYAPKALGSKTDAAK